MTTSPASMGGPQSEAERIAEIRARLDATSPRDAGYDIGSIEAEAIRLTAADSDLQATAPADLAYLLELVGVLEGQLATAQEQLRKLSKLQCQPTDSDDSELSWEDGYNAALAEVRYLAAEVLPETIAERHRPQEVYLEFHEFPVQSSKRVICAECSGQPVPWDVDEASIVLWPCAEAVALGLDGGGSGE